MEVSIQLKNIYKNFATTQALQGVSSYFAPGTLHGLIGPEGAGKTTLLRIMLHLMAAAQGQVEYTSTSGVLDFEDIRPMLAYMPQQQSLYPDLSIDEHLRFFSQLYQIPPAIYHQKRSELLQLTRLAPFVDRAASKLSGGMYKKLGLMCALLRSPQIIFLDEPTNGVDPISRRELWDLLYRLQEEKIMIIITTAYMDEAERCHEVHLLSEGKMMQRGEPKTILQQAGVRNFDEYFLQQN